MQCAGVEERGRAGAEAATLIKIVETDNPLLALCRLLDEETHGDTHPEELRCFQAAHCFFGFVDDEVAIVERLNPKEIKVHIGCGIDGISENIEIVSEKFRRETLDSNSCAKIALEGLAMSIAETFDAVALDFPVEDFLINVREHDASCELGEVGIALDERAGIQNNRVFQNVFGHLTGKGTAKLALDVERVDVQIEADHRKLDSLPQLGAIPENALAVALHDHDEGFLDIAGLCFGFRFDDLLAVAGALGTVENIALGDFVVALAHEFLLHEILHILDVDKCRVASTDALTHTPGNRCGGLGVFLHGKECAAAGGLDFGFHPRNNSAIAANQANIHRLRLQNECGCASRADRAFENKALCDIMSVVFDESFFDEERQIMLGEAKRTALLGPLGEAQSHRVGHIRDEAAILLVEDVFLLARKKQVGEGFSDFVRDIGEVERLFVAVGACHRDSRERVCRGGNRFAPGEVGLLVAWHGDEALQRDIFVEREVSRHVFFG